MSKELAGPAALVRGLGFQVKPGTAASVRAGETLDTTASLYIQNSNLEGQSPHLGLKWMCSGMSGLGEKSKFVGLTEIAEIGELGSLCTGARAENEGRLA